jgi:O-antigen/teichoic acid export membrane protein
MSIAFGSLIGSLGSEATIIVWSSRARRSGGSWLPAVMLWVASGCTLAMGLWTLVYWQWRPSFLRGLTPPLAWLVLASIPASVLFSALMSLLIGEERFRLRSVLAVLNRAASLTAFLWLVVVVGKLAESAVLANLVGLVLGGCAAILFVRHSVVDGWKVSEARQNLLPTLLFGIRGQAGNLATFFSYRLDVFVVNYFLDATQVGLYALGVMVSEAMWQVPGVVSVALCPRTAKTIGAGAENFTSMIIRQVFFATLAVGVLIALVAPLAVPLIFGARFTPSVPVIWWILPGTVALSVSKVICADLTGRGLNTHTAISSYIGLTCTLILDLALIPKMGIQGAALASSLAYSSGTVYLFLIVRRELNATVRELLVPTPGDLQPYRTLWASMHAGRLERVNKKAR